MLLIIGLLTMSLVSEYFLLGLSTLKKYPSEPNILLFLKSFLPMNVIVSLCERLSVASTVSICFQRYPPLLSSAKYSHFKVGLYLWIPSSMFIKALIIPMSRGLDKQIYIAGNSHRLFSSTIASPVSGILTSRLFNSFSALKLFREWPSPSY